jgi:hypothetical protein
MTDQLIRTTAELVAANIQSPNWERYYPSSHLNVGRGEWISGGFGEPLPKPKHRLDEKPQVYDLITRRLQILTGTPLFAADAPAYRPSRDEWLVEAQGRPNERYSTFAVIAWKEHEDHPAAPTA